MITLDNMSEMASALLEAEQKTKAADEVLKKAKEHERILREETIPSAMHELGFESIKLDSGQKITVRQDVYASIPVAKRDMAYTWLTSNGFGGLIKTEVSTTYDRGDLEKAIVFCHELQELGLKATLKQSVHAQTMKAFLREQLANGENVPLDLFGARPVFVTKIK